MGGGEKLSIWGIGRGISRKIRTTFLRLSPVEPTVSTKESKENIEKKVHCQKSDFCRGSISFVKNGTKKVLRIYNMLYLRI